MDSSQDNIDNLLGGGNTAVVEAEVERRAPAAPPVPQPPTSSPKTSADPKPDRLSLSRLLALEVPVIVKLANRSMSVLDVTQFKLGSILEFDLPADSELDLLVNNKCIGHGTAVKVGENFGLRVSKIKTPEQRVRALG
jgi:flagellar motor switch protein FliN/FliY